MTDTEQEYFDEYKRLDNLCKDMFSVPNGVTTYIETMSECYADACRIVRGWKEEYKKIKYLRHLRNRIVHDSEQTDCSRADISAVREFYKSLLNQEDPLALYRKAKSKGYRGYHSRNAAGAGNASCMGNITFFIFVASLVFLIVGKLV